MALTAENYGNGFLVDDELMGGVTSAPDRPGAFVAFVLRHTTGESLGYRVFPDLDSALRAVNQVKRGWKFESTSGCGVSGCAGERCKKGCANARKAASGPPAGPR